MGKKKTKPRKKMYIEQDEINYELLKVSKILEKIISLNATDSIAQGKRRNSIFKNLTIYYL